MNTITNKWRQTGLLENLATESQCDELALLLENTALRLFRDNIPPYTPESQQFAGMLLPLVRRIYDTIKPIPPIDHIYDDFRLFLTEKKQSAKEIDDAVICEEYVKRHELIKYDKHCKEEYRKRLPQPTVSASIFIGMTLEEAEKNRGGWSLTPSEIDGRTIHLSASYNPLLVGVRIKNNIIIGTDLCI
jgi:hypothetical protein